MLIPHKQLIRWRLKQHIAVASWIILGMVERDSMKESIMWEKQAKFCYFWWNWEVGMYEGRGKKSFSEELWKNSFKKHLQEDDRVLNLWWRRMNQWRPKAAWHKAMTKLSLRLWFAWVYSHLNLRRHQRKFLL